MRAAFLAILLVNVMFLAWAEWIDVPVLPPNSIAGLPRLKLVSETSRGTPAATAEPASPVAQSAAGASAGAGASAAQCISVGPFDNDADVAHASTLLKSQGLSSRQRVTQSTPVRSYWVYVHNPGGGAQANHLLHQLTAAGIAGAESLAMGGKQQISLGLFQDKQLALRQQKLAREKGFKPVLTERLVSQPVYWLDFWVAGSTDAPALQALKAKLGTPIDIQSCPPKGSQAVSPGMPAPEATATASPPSP